MNATERRAAVTRIVSAQVEVEREHSTETVEVCGNVLMPASPSDEMAVRVTSVVSHFSGRSQAEQWTTKVQEQFEQALIDEACVQADAEKPMATRAAVVSDLGPNAEPWEIAVEVSARGGGWTGGAA